MWLKEASRDDEKSREKRDRKGSINKSSFIPFPSLPLPPPSPPFQEKVAPQRSERTLFRPPASVVPLSLSPSFFPAAKRRLGRRIEGERGSLRKRVGRRRGKKDCVWSRLKWGQMESPPHSRTHAPYTQGTHVREPLLLLPPFLRRERREQLTRGKGKPSSSPHGLHHLSCERPTVEETRRRRRRRKWRRKQCSRFFLYFSSLPLYPFLTFASRRKKREGIGRVIFSPFKVAAGGGGGTHCENGW